MNTRIAKFKLKKANQKLKWKPKVNFAELVKIMYEHDLALAENEVSRKTQISRNS